MGYDGVTHALLTDMIATTQSKEKWDGQWVYLRGRHDYPLLNLFFHGAGMPDTISGGKSVKWNAQYRENGQSQATRPGMIRERQLVQTMTTAELGWVQAYGSYGILKREMLENWGDQQIINLVKTKREAGLRDLANTLEPILWNAGSSSTDDLAPAGISYWLPPITGAQVLAGTGAGAHQGTAHTSFSNTAGIDASDAAYARWCSYNDTWSNSSGEVTEEDLRRMGRAWRRAHFKNPIGLGTAAVPTIKLFLGACETIVDSFSSAARRNNDETGADPAKYYGAGLSADGAPIFKGTPLVWCEDLDAHADYTAAGYPLVGLNLDEWKPRVFRDCNFVEELQPVFRDQPDLFVTDIDLMYQISVWNRQACGFVISYVASA